MQYNDMGKMGWGIFFLSKMKKKEKRNAVCFKGENIHP
jgi:hypothetical protein